MLRLSRNEGNAALVLRVQKVNVALLTKRVEENGKKYTNKTAKQKPNG